MTITASEITRRLRHRLSRPARSGSSHVAIPRRWLQILIDGDAPASKPKRRRSRPAAPPAESPDTSDADSPDADQSPQ